MGKEAGRGERASGGLVSGGGLEVTLLLVEDLLSSSMEKPILGEGESRLRLSSGGLNGEASPLDDVERVCS